MCMLVKALRVKKRQGYGLFYAEKNEGDTDHVLPKVLTWRNGISQRFLINPDISTKL